MLLSFLRFYLSKQSFIVSTCLIIGLSVPGVSMAQRPMQDDLRSRTMETLDASEATQLLAFFKAQRLEENFCFHFQLRQKPRRGRSVNYEGIMYGSWNEEGPISRFRLYPDAIDTGSPANTSPIEIIVQNGRSPRVWMRKDAKAFTLVEDASLFEPIFDGILYTPFDLQMPFIFWDDYKYVGPSRVLSRIGQKFLMFPPSGSLAERYEVNAVRVSIDDTYCALLRAEVLGDDYKARSQFTVRGIKKIQDRYIVKEVELKNLSTKDATSFKVKAASVGLELANSIFDPDNPEELPEISTIPLEEL